MQCLVGELELPCCALQDMVHVTTRISSLGSTVVVENKVHPKPILIM